MNLLSFSITDAAVFTDIYIHLIAFQENLMFVLKQAVVI